jgi:hypothetical protein
MRKNIRMKNFVLSFGNSCRCVGLVVMMGWLVACGEDPQQLFETAQFEEQQQNRAHAQELYERILRDHPESAAARKAEERLKEWRKENP